MKESFASYEFGMVGLLFFFGLFMAILYWLFRPGVNRAEFIEHGNIPLEDDKYE